MARGFAPSRCLKYRSRDRRIQSSISLVCFISRSLNSDASVYASRRSPSFILTHSVSEARRTGKALGVPGNMLARDLASGFTAVKRVQLLQMRNQHAMDFRDERVRELLTGRKIVLDFAEDPRPPLSGSADHDA